MANARDLFDPAIQQAQFVGDRVAGLTAADVVAQGGELVAQWEFRMDSNAQLTALERHVKTDSLGKVFGDGEVFAAIPDTPRTANVSMFKMKDGSGIQIAQLNGGERAMEALLAKASQDDLELMPKYRAPKPKAPTVQEEKKGTLVIADGTALKVILEDKKVEAPAVIHRDPIPLHRAAGGIGIPMNNPVAVREFLKRAWTATSQAMPMQSAADMPIAAMVAASPEVHPADTSWPEGITVIDVRNGGAAIESPKRAMVAFAAALEGREGPVITRDDVMEQFKARKKGM
jgi:hypothetical protein